MLGCLRLPGLFTGDDPAVGRVRRSPKTRGSSRVGAGGDRSVMGQLESGHEAFKSHGTGRVGSRCSGPTRER